MTNHSTQTHPTSYQRRTAEGADVLDEHATIVATGRRPAGGPAQGAARPNRLATDGSQWIVGPDPAHVRALGEGPREDASASREAIDSSPAGGTPALGVRVAVHGLHGGAGASTVAAMLRSQGVDAYEPDRPDATHGPDRSPDRRDVAVLVLRSTAPATALLARSLLTWRAQLGGPPVLITVPDLPTGAPPAAARYRLRALRGDYRGPLKVPWLWQLREADHYDQIATTKKAAAAARQLLDDLNRITNTTLGKA